MGRNELHREVLARVQCGALHPVGRFLAGRREPGAGVAPEDRPGVDPHEEALALVLAQRHGRRVGPLLRRVVRQVVERAAQRLDGTRADVRRPLGHLDAAEVHRIEEAVRLGAAPVVRGAVREAVDRRADLHVVDRHLEAAHGDVARPVVETVGVPLLDRNTGQVVHDRCHRGDVRLLPDHRLGDEVSRERPGLLGHHRDGLQEARDPQDQPDVFRRPRAERNRSLRGLEAQKNRRDDVVAGHEARACPGAVALRDPLLAHARAGNRHGYTGQRITIRVDDDALDGSCCLGRCRRGGRQQQDGESQASWPAMWGIHQNNTSQVKPRTRGIPARSATTHSSSKPPCSASSRAASSCPLPISTSSRWPAWRKLPAANRRR